MNRRAVLKHLALVPSLLSGCLFASAPDDCSPDDPPPDGFELRNRGSERHEVTVEVIHELLLYSNTIFSESYEIDPPGGENVVRVSDVAEYAGHHVIKAEVDTGNSVEYLWEVTPDECDPVTIVVQDGDVQIGAPGEISRGPTGPSP